MAALNPGTRLDHYEITGAIGAGGMGEVYSATDTKLGRSVAIKTLPSVFTHDADRVARFKREAKTLAALNHPNIAIIHGLEESGGQQFLVMELVEGETLADKLLRGPLPVGEALRIATQIAQALEAAHEKTIIHRDLKPANVKITPDGKVKVLDFGLAKAFEGEASGASLSNSPTLTGAGTGAGMILGTAGYMSPEQAKGFTVDQRSDVFSFGCILYEMLTGKTAFDGDSVSEILASVLKVEPDFQQLPPTLHPRLRELLQWTLAKNSKRRIHAMADVLLEIESIASSPAVAAQTGASPARSSRMAWIVAVVAVLAFVSLAVVYFREKPAENLSEMRVDINTPSAAPLEFALSPDGRYIAFVGSTGGYHRLWLRALDKVAARLLDGTDGVDYPFWSPDSRSIGFTASSKLMRADIAGGPPRFLARTFASFGAAWNRDGTIIFTTTPGPLSRIADSGGESAVVTRAELAQQHRFPHFLPDGRHFLYYTVGSTSEGAGIYLGSLDSLESKRLAPADSSAEYLPPDMVAFVRGTSLLAQHLDLQRGELTGDLITIADPVGTFQNGGGGFSISGDGRIAYRAGPVELRQLIWYDRAGKVVGKAEMADSATILYPELSRDGTRLAFSRTSQGNTDVWIMDLAQGSKLTRFTVEPTVEIAPIWSPDGKQIVFASSRIGSGFGLYVKASNNTGVGAPLADLPAGQNARFPQDWSKDGKYLLYSEINPKTGRDLWALPMSGADRKPFVVADTAFDELNGQFAPEGNMIAYETNQSGETFQIVVQSFPKPDGAVPVSKDGGMQPRWSADGKELYFIAPDGKMMAASITVTGSTITAGIPVPLFNASPASGLGANRQNYAVSRDGKFLIDQQAESSSATPITLILNWRHK
jgi:serine/threonine protein kinase